MIRNERNYQPINYWLTAFTTRTPTKKMLLFLISLLLLNSHTDNARFHLLQFNLSLPLTFCNSWHLCRLILLPGECKVWKLFCQRYQTLIIYVVVVASAVFFSSAFLVSFSTLAPQRAAFWVFGTFHGAMICWCMLLTTMENIHQA